MELCFSPYLSNCWPNGHTGSCCAASWKNNGIPIFCSESLHPNWIICRYPKNHGYHGISNWWNWTVKQIHRRVRWFLGYINIDHIMRIIRFIRINNIDSCWIFSEIHHVWCISWPQNSKHPHITKDSQLLVQKVRWPNLCQKKTTASSCLEQNQCHQNICVRVDQLPILGINSSHL